MNTLNYLSGKTLTQNVFGQNYINNNINNSQLENTRKLNDISTINNNNSINTNKETIEKINNNLKIQLTKDNTKSKLNDRLETLNEEYEINNNILSEKKNILPENFLKEKMKKLSNNNIDKTNNNNNYTKINNNKVSLISPSSNRDFGIFDSNFVIKTDKRSFLLIDNNKRTVSEDK